MNDFGTNIFPGFIDADADDYTIENKNFRDAHNIRKGHGSVHDIIQDYIGNSEVEIDTWPDGVNTPVGAVEDKITGRLYVLYHNDNDNHWIARFDTLTDEYIFCYTSPGLDFSLDNPISGIGIHVIDGDKLVWVDGRVEGTTISGNEPKKLNLNKIVTTGLDKEYDLCFPQNYFEDSDRTLTVRIIDNGVITNTDINILAASFVDLETSLAALATSLEGIAGIASAEVSLACIRVTLDTDVTLLLFTDTGTFYYSGFNFYSQYVKSTAYFSSDPRLWLIKPLPPYRLKPSYRYEDNGRGNLRPDTSYQFMYRYIFDQDERSTFSPWSYTPTNYYWSDEDITNDPTEADPYQAFAYENKILNNLDFNFIRIRLDANCFIFINEWREVITGVEIAFRTGEEELWYTMGDYRLNELTYEDDTAYVDFYHDESYRILSSDDAAEPDVQAFKMFDNVPRIASGLNPISDEKGITRLTIGSNLERYDQVDVEANVTVYYDSPDYADKTLSEGDEQTCICSLKTGGIYDVFIEYEDFMGRRAPQQYLDTVYVDRRTTSLGLIDPYPTLPYLRVEMLSTPPIWAHRWRVCISKNHKQSRYLQMGTDQKQFVNVNYDEGTVTIIDVADHFTDPSGTSHVMFSFFLENVTGVTYSGITGGNNASLLDTFYDIKVSKEKMTPAENDKLVLVNLKEKSGIVGAPAPGVPVEMDVSGYAVNLGTANIYVDGINYLEIYVPYEPYASDLDGIHSIRLCNLELYRTLNDDTAIGYEFSDTFDISAPGAVSRNHGGTKSLGPTCGDTFTYTVYELQLNFIYKHSYYERPSMYDVGNTMSSYGRGNVEDRSYAERYLYNQMRVSDVYIPNSEVNGLTAFRGLEFANVQREFGPIMGMVNVQSIMLVICQNKAQPVYTNKDRLIGVSGESLTVVTNNLLNIGEELQGDYGTRNPESVVCNDGKVYWWDVFRGAVLRYSVGGGVFPISEFGYARVFHNKGASRITIDRADDWTRGGYDRKHKQYYLTFQKDGVFVTYSWKDQGERGGWMGTVSFQPYCYGNVGNKFFSFNPIAGDDFGKLYIHDLGSYNTFYGVESLPYITFVMNKDPQMKKVFKNIRVKSNKKFTADPIRVPVGNDYASGQLSRLKANKFESYENDWWATFLRDMNDTSSEFLDIVDNTERQVTALLRGRPLRGDVIIITLNATEGNILLRSVDIEYFVSQKTR